MSSTTLITFFALYFYIFNLSAQVTFNEVATGPFANDKYPTPSAAWEDYDLDGDLDVFICNGENNYHNFLYINNGNGTFQEATNLNILTPNLYSLGATWGDFNNDGWPDLFISHGNYNYSQQSSLFINNGNNKFTPITIGNIVTSFAVSQGCGWADYNKDGFLDLYIANIGDQNGNLGNATNELYKNNGDNTFSQVTSGSIVTDVGGWMSCVWGDYNNDGWPDLFTPTSLARTASIEIIKMVHSQKSLMI